MVVKNIAADHVNFLWITKSSRAGDDVTLVYDMVGDLRHIPRGSWKIIWDESEY